MTNDAQQARPWWWLAIIALLGLLGAGASTGAFLVLTGAFDELPLLCGLAGGMFFGVALLGHFPGRYEALTGHEKFVLWVPLSLAQRAGIGAASLAVGAGGFLLALA